MLSKYKKMMQLSLALAVGAGASAFIIPNEASAQTTTQQLCFRGNTISVPSYLVSRYVAAGAVPGPCVTSP